MHYFCNAISDWFFCFAPINNLIYYCMKITEISDFTNNNFRHLAGEEVPEHWRGGMEVKYRYGNGFLQPGW